MKFILSKFNVNL